MIVEISGVGFHNLGAELMLMATLEQLGEWPEVDQIGVHFRVSGRRQRQSLGICGVIRLEVNRRRWAADLFASAVNRVPQRVLGGWGLTSPARVSALLDASGFAFGDAWGPRAARRKGNLLKAYHDAGRPVVLLPQAFGPFQKDEVASATRVALESADLIYARDEESEAYVRDLGLRHPAVKTAPDFTNLLAVDTPAIDKRLMIIMPNGRMTQMRTDVNSDNYVTFLVRCAQAASDLGYRVGVIAHEPMDRAVAERLVAESHRWVQMLEPSDALDAKFLAGQAAVVVSSRYHGLINALSQGTPAIGTAWSHKYPQLFKDYGCEDGLWSTRDLNDASTKMQQWLDDGRLEKRRQALRKHAEQLRGEAAAMWRDVRDFLTAR